MKPIKGLMPFATWLMRFALGIFLFITFFSTLKAFEYHTTQFYIAAAYLLFISLLFIGGFLSKQGITVFSALILFLLSIYEIFVNYSSSVSPQMAVFILVAAVSLFFLTAGNKN
jgi:hypothetical protein